MDKIAFAYIAGSGTRGLGEEPLKFPEELIQNTEGIKIVEDRVQFGTRWGTTVPMRILEIDGIKVVWCPMHNWQKGFTGTQSSLQLFHLLNKFEVQYIVAEASVGGLLPLKPWDLVIPDDLVAFNDNLVRLAVEIEGLPVFIRMAEPLCPEIRQILIQAVNDAFGIRGPLDKYLEQGVYVSKPQGRFESPAEIQIINQWRKTAFGGKPTVVGESLGLDAEGARRIGAHVAELCLVANYAEGTGPTKKWWVEEGRENFYQKCPPLIAPIMLRALRFLIKNPPKTCNCRYYYEDAVATSTL